MAFATQLAQTGIGVAASVGAQWEPVDNLWLGLSVQTPVLLVYSSVSESSSLGNAIIQQDNGQQGVGVFDTSDTTSSDATLELVVPARVRLGVAYEAGPVSFSVEGDVQHKLRNANFDVDRKFLWNLRAGIQGKLSPTMTLGAGFFTDRSPEQPARTLGAADVDFYGFSLGLSYLKDRRLDAAVEKHDRLTFGSTFGLRYAYGRGDFGGAALSDTFADFNDLVREGPRRATIHEIALYIGTSFLF